MKRILVGLALAVVAFLSYFFLFARFPITRDVPWANFLLFAAALALVVSGWRRTPRKVLATIVGVVPVAIAGFFAFAHHARRCGQAVERLAAADLLPRLLVTVLPLRVAECAKQPREVREARNSPGRD